MKIIIFQGGLGNQIFQYAYYKYLENKNRNQRINYIFETGNSHNGFELDKWFIVNLQKAPIIFRFTFKILRLLRNKGICNLIIDQDATPHKNGFFISGYWQNKKFYDSNFIQFKNLELSDHNKSILNKILNTQSISIHVRRGDYIKEPYNAIYGNVCTLEYYTKAISIIKKHFDNPQFFIFSDDIEWVKQNLSIDNATYIDWNTKENSIYDMYLMSHAAANIIANSTFSYWGAFFNKRADYVIYPKKWFNSRFSAPDIFPNYWYGI